MAPSELEDVAAKARALTGDAQRAVLAIVDQKDAVRQLHGMVPTDRTPSSAALREALYAAERAMGKAADAMQECAGTAARFASSLAGDGPSGAGAGTPAAAQRQPPEAAGDDARSPSQGILPAGFSMVPLDLIDSSDREISAASFDKGTSSEDLAWALEALRDVVLPGLERGMTAEQFRELDTQQGRAGTRSYLTTYSKFFGQGDAIRLARRADGTWEVENGYHRIWVARRLGLSHVPARTSGVR